MVARSTKDFENLEDFKEWMNTEFVKHCTKKYGEELYNRYILPYVSDMMENIEVHIGDLANKSVHDEELSYNDEELEYGFENS